VTTARERNRAIHPIFSAANKRKSAPDTTVIAATSSAAFCSPEMPAASTALAATAARLELGPVEIWRLVPKIA
jgi:hypothetical protein